MALRGRTTGKARLERAWCIEMLSAGNSFILNILFCIYQMMIPLFLLSQYSPLSHSLSHSLFDLQSIMLPLIPQEQYHAEQTLSHDMSPALCDCLACFPSDLQLSYSIHASSFHFTKSTKPSLTPVFTQRIQNTSQYPNHPPLKPHQARRYAPCVRSPAR